MGVICGAMCVCSVRAYGGHMEVKSDQTCVRRLSFDVSSELQIYWFHYSSCRPPFFSRMKYTSRAPELGFIFI